MYFDASSTKALREATPVNGIPAHSYISFEHRSIQRRPSPRRSSNDLSPKRRPTCQPSVVVKFCSHSNQLYHTFRFCTFSCVMFAVEEWFPGCFLRHSKQLFILLVFHPGIWTMLVFTLWIHGKLKWLTMGVLKVIQVCGHWFVLKATFQDCLDACRLSSRCFIDSCTGAFDSLSQTVWFTTDLTYNLSFWQYLTPTGMPLARAFVVLRWLKDPSTDCMALIFFRHIRNAANEFYSYCVSSLFGATIHHQREFDDFIFRAVRFPK